MDCEDGLIFACGLVGLIPGGGECESSSQCASGELCSSTGVCGEIVTGCLPTCGGDFDCASGQFCRLASGLCVDEEPDGLPIGSACTVEEPDPCNGFCVPIDEGDEGECTAFCTISPQLTGCGWSGEGPADAACLFGTILSPPGDIGIGDLGICGKMCDCNADCPIEGDYCVDESGGVIVDIWGRNGYCRPLEGGETEADSFSECP